MVNAAAMRQQRQSATAVREIFAGECQRCGICCVIYNQSPFGIGTGPTEEGIPTRWVQVGPHKPENNEFNKYLRIVPLKDRQFTGTQSFNRCVALEGKVRQSVTCVIYENRPPCCRNFDPGSPACIESRRWASMEDPEDLLWMGRS